MSDKLDLGDYLLRINGNIGTLTCTRVGTRNTSGQWDSELETYIRTHGVLEVGLDTFYVASSTGNERFTLDFGRATSLTKLATLEQLITCGRYAGALEVEHVRAG